MNNEPSAGVRESERLLREAVKPDAAQYFGEGDQSDEAKLWRAAHHYGTSQARALRGENPCTPFTMMRFFDLLQVARAQSARIRQLEKTEERMNTLLYDPVGGRHLLHLLSEGKGTREDFLTMLDRIKCSRNANNIDDSKEKKHG